MDIRSIQQPTKFVLSRLSTRCGTGVREFYVLLALNELSESCCNSEYTKRLMNYRKHLRKRPIKRVCLLLLLISCFVSTYSYWFPLTLMLPKVTALQWPLRNPSTPNILPILERKGKRGIMNLILRNLKPSLGLGTVKNGTKYLFFPQRIFLTLVYWDSAGWKILRLTQTKSTPLCVDSH